MSPPLLSNRNPFVKSPNLYSTFSSPPVLCRVPTLAICLHLQTNPFEKSPNLYLACASPPVRSSAPILTMR